MEFPEERYYRLNRILLSTAGLWPYDNTKVRQLRFTVLLSILISVASAQLLKIYVSRHEFDTVLNVLCTCITLIMMTLKYVTFYIIVDNVKLFRKYILDSWRSLRDDREIQIIHKQARAGKICTIFITTFSYFTFLLFIFLQHLPYLLDVIKPLNISRPRTHFVPVEYFIDQQKYYHIIAVHIDIGLITIVLLVLATETFALTNALFVFGLFKVTSYRMKGILNGNHLQICPTKKHHKFVDRIIAAVDMHKRAFQYSDLLKKCFGPIYLLLFIGAIFAISINMFYLSRIITTDKGLYNIFKHITFIIMHLIPLTAANYAGQQFINCDSDVGRAICNMRWYNAPLKTQKLIFFLMQKTTKCYKVDAGGMFCPSLEGLATSLSMSISYLMLFRSI